MTSQKEDELMSEIVTRLRDYQQWLDDKKPIADFICDIDGDRTCERAASEIERLEKIRALFIDVDKRVVWEGLGFGISDAEKIEDILK